MSAADDPRWRDDPYPSPAELAHRAGFNLNSEGDTPETPYGDAETLLVKFWPGAPPATLSP